MKEQGLAALDNPLGGKAKRRNKGCKVQRTQLSIEPVLYMFRRVQCLGRARGPVTTNAAFNEDGLDGLGCFGGRSTGTYYRYLTLGTR